MIFTSIDFLVFLAIQMIFFLTVRPRNVHNAILLVSGYIFYGYVHPWFCLLILAFTLVDFSCGKGIEDDPANKKKYLYASIFTNLGLLGFFKYYNFFTENVNAVFTGLGLPDMMPVLSIFLPVGISFYTFQTLSYTIDIYKGKDKACRNLLDFALYVSFFPQLVAGPIERANRLLPQIQNDRKFDFDKFASGFALMSWGFLKKMVIADNVSIYVNKIYMLEEPSQLMLFVGTIGFAVQIFADFSAYTDIARGVSRMLGFELIENFKAPYVAISPSDFWRRWHISFSTWIRDYLYIPLGGSRVATQTAFFIVVVTSMGISGLWHGAAWNFVAWGVYHGVILFIYHRLGLGGKWKPTGKIQTFVSWFVMILLTLFGWALFRTTSMTWLIDVCLHSPLYINTTDLVSIAYIALLIAFYCSFFLFKYLIDPIAKRNEYVGALAVGLAIAFTIMLGVEGGGDFIYFQF